jgi:hypothetical protein
VLGSEDETSPCTACIVRIRRRIGRTVFAVGEDCASAREPLLASRRVTETVPSLLGATSRCHLGPGQARLASVLHVLFFCLLLYRMSEVVYYVVACFGLDLLPTNVMEQQLQRSGGQSAMAVQTKRHAKWRWHVGVGGLCITVAAVRHAQRLDPFSALFAQFRIGQAGPRAGLSTVP